MRMFKGGHLYFMWNLKGGGSSTCTLSTNLNGGVTRFVPEKREGIAYSISCIIKMFLIT